jgi:subtilisin family serine protease
MSRISFKFLFVIYLSCFGCKSQNYFPLKIDSNIEIIKNKKFSLKELKNWEFKDILSDTISGISLNRAYDSILNFKKSKEVIVAVLDMAVEMNHIGLKNNIWLNKKEIPYNNIDDDRNGYIDDLNGWNFLGKENSHNEFVNYEYTRILKKYNSKFSGETINTITKKDSAIFLIFKKAEVHYNNRLKFAKKDLEYIKMVTLGKLQAESLISEYLKNSYTQYNLDSLKNTYPNDKELQKMIRRKSNFIKNGYSDSYISDYRLKAEERINKLLNLEYIEREIQGDNSDDLEDRNYGSPIFNKNTTLLDHGTKMAGIIKKVGLKNEIKIMPLTISAYGDEHDKDIALAIRYAVDNGAKVINMSFAKEFSLYPKWVFEAIKYAQNKNVLIVSASANENQNIDDKDIFWFPNDHNYFNDIEISANFMKIGSSGKYIDSNLKSAFSNYGKIEVDLFAPGEDIYTTHPNNEFKISYGGTSSAAALTSGVAALMYSYYPNLSVYQIKHILMNSGLEYSIIVKTPTKENLNKNTQFNNLSKSGKILNIYNAVIQAQKL